jgi:hypothetical protein
MQRVRKFSIIAIVILFLGVSALSVWLTVSPPDLLLVATGYAAKVVCTNVFVAKRDVDAVIGTDVELELSHAVKRMRIIVDTDKQRVDVAYLGLFAKRHAQYAEGRGCTLDSTDEATYRAAATPYRHRRLMRSGLRATGCNCQTTSACWLR